MNWKNNQELGRMTRTFFIIIKSEIKNDFIKKIVISRIEKYTFTTNPNITNLIEKIDNESR